MSADSEMVYNALKYSLFLYFFDNFVMKISVLKLINLLGLCGGEVRFYC
ncbi:hypothetical protein J524_0664 [Acinetobacter baumannii 496487]|uniref:Uncharacterized protein n=1 Tax=Acinetobacter baumannii 1499986 TaxID=1310673 RepID=A0A836LYN8_ACIBA|nr:hypothetical protein J552_0820 [Acinetobacter baumannii 951631]EXE67359.1 hypothetical protein J585_1959 [Acinetobacter baumannii 397971]EXG13182.1 hypothetical protein J712_0369 [Acinetobacter baumannii 722310]EXH54255.1 hypothetical protein J620_3138 [Acinetobacter baumannii 1533268]EXI00980.1 hypothetical protein J618_1838 [Acinetobacter baumannii 607805]EXI03850.1 hypothetical protein J639_2273 [Acinetobacter baumannii 457946]EXQ93543.1 hypothetical protein J681_0586 [Acinetobacter bau